MQTISSDEWASSSWLGLSGQFECHKAFYQSVWCRVDWRVHGCPQERVRGGSLCPWPARIECSSTFKKKIVTF